MQYDNCIKPISTLHQGCIGSRAGRIAQGATIPSFSAIEALASGFLLGEVIEVYRSPSKLWQRASPATSVEAPF